MPNTNPFCAFTYVSCQNIETPMISMPGYDAHALELQHETRHVDDTNGKNKSLSPSEIQ